MINPGIALFYHMYDLALNPLKPTIIVSSLVFLPDIYFLKRALSGKANQYVSWGQTASITYLVVTRFLFLKMWQEQQEFFNKIYNSGYNFE